MPTTIRQPRWDAPFWAGVLLTTFALSSLACFGYGGLIASHMHPNQPIVAMD